MDVLVVVAVAIVVGCLAVGVVMDRRAAKRGSTLTSASAIGQAIKEAKRDTRAGRGLNHLGQGASAPRSTRPSWDDRRG